MMNTTKATNTVTENTHYVDLDCMRFDRELGRSVFGDSREHNRGWLKFDSFEAACERAEKYGNATVYNYQSCWVAEWRNGERLENPHVTEPMSTESVEMQWAFS